MSFSCYGDYFSLPEALTEVPNPDAPQKGIHLYHFNTCFYSQIVRQVLDEGEVEFTTHTINLNLHDNYKPFYLKINPWAVVPTFVKDGKVTTNSENILKTFIEELAPKLIPEDEAEKKDMEEFITEMHRVKHVILTYGDIKGFPKPWPVQKLLDPQYEQKKNELTELVAKHENDSDQFLLHVYKSRLQGVSEIIRNYSSEEYVTEAFAVLLEVLDKAEKQLNDGPFSNCESEEGFLCSKEFSLADVHYGVLLKKLCTLNIGTGKLWSEHERPTLAKYAAKLFGRPTFKTAIQDYHGFNLMWTLGSSFVSRSLGFDDI